MVCIGTTVAPLASVTVNCTWKYTPYSPTRWKPLLVSNCVENPATGTDIVAAPWAGVSSTSTLCARNAAAAADRQIHALLHRRGQRRAFAQMKTAAGEHEPARDAQRHSQPLPAANHGRLRRIGTRDSGLGTRDSGLGTRDSGKA